MAKLCFAEVHPSRALTFFQPGLICRCLLALMRESVPPKLAERIQTCIDHQIVGHVCFGHMVPGYQIDQEFLLREDSFALKRGIGYRV